MSQEAATKAYQQARAAYAAGRSEKALTISGVQDGWVEWLEQTIKPH